jgi:hypothetical protein
VARKPEARRLRGRGSARTRRRLSARSSPCPARSCLWSVSGRSQALSFAASGQRTISA